MVQEVVITYETLYDILQREKDKTDLQKLEPNFFNDVISYIKDKKKLLESPDDSIFAREERKKTERQLENIHKLIKDIYEKREKKIILLALDKSRTNSNLIDTTALLREEKAFFEALASVFDTYRGEIMTNVLNEKSPFMHKLEVRKPSQEFASALELNKKMEDDTPSSENTRLVRFLSHVPKFVGTELEEYGPFQSEDIANLPTAIADVLLSKGKAEEISKVRQ